jgi:DNA-directed RNA polymerase subunit D
MTNVGKKVEDEGGDLKMVDMKAQGEEFIFTLDKDAHAFGNVLRRIIIDEVPTFAIEDVEVVAQESPLYDEVLAHRLGLIPLTSDLKSYNFKEDCKCGAVGCALCEVKLFLKVQEPGYVYSKDIKSDDPKVVAFDKEIPITKLFGEKKLELNMKAVLGRGKTHAKWSPAHAYMREGKKGVELVVEPFGQLGAKEIYNGALDILKEKITVLEGEL